MTKAEKYIENYTKRCSNDIVGWDEKKFPIYKGWLTPDQARRAVKIAREELIDKACEWLKEQKEMIGVSFQEDFYERLKKAMEE